MMSFALEAWATELPDMLGPKIKEYVRRIHDRYVPLGRSCCTLTDVLPSCPRPAYQRVSFHGACARSRQLTHSVTGTDERG